jgi:hypothetical protein
MIDRQPESEIPDASEIEWSEGGVLKLAGVGTEAAKEVRERVGAEVGGRRRCESRREVGIGSGVRRTGAAGSEPCGVFAVVAELFHAA